MKRTRTEYLRFWSPYDLHGNGTPMSEYNHRVCDIVEVTAKGILIRFRDDGSELIAWEEELHELAG